jgi:hypothetical protein
VNIRMLAGLRAGRGVLLVFLMAACATALADPPQPVAATTDIENAPAVAFASDGTGLLAYERRGRIIGQRLDSQGRAVGSAFTVLPPPGLPSSELSYANPDIGFFGPSGEFVIAAQESRTQTIWLPSGPLVWTLPSGIAVTSFNAAGARRAIRWLRSPGVGPARSESRPVVATDDPGRSDGPAPMLAVAWQEATAPTSVILQRLDTALTPLGAAQQIELGLIESVHNLSVANPRGRGEFTLVADVIQRGGERTITLVGQPYSASTSATVRTLASRAERGRLDQPPSGHPSVQFSPQINAYVAAWSDASNHWALRFSYASGFFSRSPARPLSTCSGILLCARASDATRLKLGPGPNGQAMLLRAVTGTFFGPGFTLRSYSTLQLWDMGRVDDSDPPAWALSLHSHDSTDFAQASWARDPVSGRAIAVYEQSTPRFDLMSVWGSP